MVELHLVDEMRDSDVDAVAGLAELAFGGRGETREERAARLREELARGWSHAWVARGPGGDAVGYLVAWLVADEIHVLDVASHPDHRRRGVARALVRSVLELARERHAVHVRLEVRRGNAPAIHLYRNAGFYVLSVRRAYYPDGEDAIDMDLEMDPVTGEILRRSDEEDVNA